MSVFRGPCRPGCRLRPLRGGTGPPLEVRRRGTGAGHVGDAAPQQRLLRHRQPGQELELLRRRDGHLPVNGVPAPALSPPSLGPPRGPCAAPPARETGVSDCVANTRRAARSREVRTAGNCRGVPDSLTRSA